MTRDEILAMKSGRELDALVAEKVMGYTREGAGWRMLNGNFTHHVRAYSDNIAAAWEVVEKMKSQGFDICINTVTERTSDIAGMNRENWHCCILKNETRSRVFAPTAPEAICKAALLAVMGEC